MKLVLRHLLWLVLSSVCTALAFGDQIETLTTFGGYRFTSDFVLHSPDGSARQLKGQAGCQSGAGFTPSGSYLVYSSLRPDGSGCEIISYNVETASQAAVLSRWWCNRLNEFATFRSGENEYLFITLTSDPDYVAIINVVTGRSVFDGYGWQSLKRSHDGRGFYYARRGFDCVAEGGTRETGEARFDSLTAWDRLWIEPVVARQRIQRSLNAVVTAFKEQNWTTLARLVHPNGFKRSDGSYVTDCDPVFTPQQITAAPQDTTHYFLGWADGSGEKVYHTLLETFLPYSRLRYTEADSLTFNERVGRGNQADNAFESYPGSIVVEYYFKGSEDNSDFTWHSTRFVFLPSGGEWFLAAITNGYWTI